MKRVDRVIVLAAGRGHQLDGATKVLIRHPATGRTILDHFIDAFAGKRITVVVGFRAIQIMEQYPQLDYVINHDWAVTNNAMSLGLALDGEPSYVTSGDIFLERALIDELDQAAPNLALTELRDNRTLTAIHCVLRDDGSIAETYQGPVKDVRHPEAIGLFKITDDELLRRWKHLSIRHGNLFVGQTLPCEEAPIAAVPRNDHPFVEINTPADYLRLLEQQRER
jgi:choline kinase